MPVDILDLIWMGPRTKENHEKKKKTKMFSIAKYVLQSRLPCFEAIPILNGYGTLGLTSQASVSHLHNHNNSACY